jgi:hypothetical protein
MPVRTSSSITTRLVISDTAITKSKVYTDTKRFTTKTGKQQTQTGLDWANRLTMIGITIFTVSVGSVVSEFGYNDLAAFNPNYELRNEFETISDPLTHYDYTVYGETVLDTVVGYVTVLGGFGEFAKGLWDGILYFVTLGGSDSVFYGSFTDEFGEARFNEILSFYSQIPSKALLFNALTTLEKQWILDNYDNQESLSNNEQVIFYGEPFAFLYIVTGPVDEDYFGLDDGSWVWFTETPSIYNYVEFYGVE